LQGKMNRVIAVVSSIRYLPARSCNAAAS
jgi:hypothetical protein